MSGETTYSIENAKSGRSGCKKCKEKIGKDELRLGVEAPGPNDYSIQSWYHPRCFTLPRKLKGIDATSFVEDMLQDNTKDQILSSQKDEIIAQIEQKPEKKKGGDNGGVGGASAKIAKIKATLETIRAERLNEDEDEPPKKKAKLDGPSEEERGAADVYEIYAKMKNDEIKDVLRWNRQMVGGNKDTMLVRMIDGHMKGRLGRCPSCTKGKLKLKEDGDIVLCSGWYDEEEQTRYPCYYSTPAGEAPRLQPWYAEEPTEEEKAEMEAFDEEQKEGKKDSSIPSPMLELAEGLEWNLDSSSAIKKAASSMVDVCTSDDANKIDLPDDAKARIMEVGKIIVANKASSAAEVLQLIVDKYGFTKSKEEEKARKREANASICGHPTNLGVYEAFQELSDLYFKEKNSNAGGTYKKAAAAIQGLDFAITADNAKGLGKGKTKVESIGKGSADKIYEFVTTGTIEKLEEKRACA